MINNYEERVLNETVVILGLLVLQEMLFMSKYPEEVQKPLRSRVELLLARYQYSRAASNPTVDIP